MDINLHKFRIYIYHQVVVHIWCEQYLVICPIKKPTLSYKTCVFFLCIYSSPFLSPHRKPLPSFHSFLILGWWIHLFLSCTFFFFLSLRGKPRVHHTRRPPLVPANKPGTIAVLASTPKPEPPHLSLTYSLSLLEALYIYFGSRES